MSVKVGLLLTRNPIILPALSPLTTVYLAYKDSKSLDAARPFLKEFYYKKGTTAAAQFDALQSKKEIVVQPKLKEFVVAPTFKTDDFNSLDRQMDKHVYLCLKSDGNWTLPAGQVSSTELLLDAAKSRLSEWFGSHADVWFIGAKPVGHLSNTFFMKSIIMAGKVVPSAETEYRWMTKDECAKDMDKEYFDRVQSMLQ
jgi:large subunit ribosomal protein L46